MDLPSARVGLLSTTEDGRCLTCVVRALIVRALACHQAVLTSTARRSFTFVRVGPVTSRLPAAAKKP